MASTIKQDLIKLRAKKRVAEELGRKHKAASNDHKQWQARCLERAEAEEIESLKSDGTLFSIVDEKHKGYVEDLAEFTGHALRTDTGVAEFIAYLERITDPQKVISEGGTLYERFCETVTNLELLQLKERGDLLNSMVRAHLDDGEPMPPGINFRPDPYISMRSS